MRPHPGVSLVLALMLVVGLQVPGKTGAGPGTPLEELENPTGPGAAPITNGRGDLVLTIGEEVRLEGSREYRKVFLDEGSRLYLVNCTLTLTGDGNEGPSISGSPDVFSMTDSRIVMRGSNGTSGLLNQGANTSVGLLLGEEFRMDRSTISLHGGEGWTPHTPGAVFDRDLASHEFSGGSCTFSLLSNDEAVLFMNDSGIELYGGSGGDAPSGEDLSSDDFFRSGGYTTGANVSGWVGSGGRAELDIGLPRGRIFVENTNFVLLGGNGGDAGDAGRVEWIGNQRCIHPTSSGGYTSGGWKDDGTPYNPGNVSGYVGAGGSCAVDIRGMNMTLVNTRFAGSGGEGGDTGTGGSCIAVSPGDPSLATYTVGGGGGGGYSGGYGGYKSLSGWDGGSGGNVSGHVGSAGDFNISLKCSEVLITSKVNIELHGGILLMTGSGGEGGGSIGAGTDGGGGGGAGYSGGGGGPAVMLYNPYVGGDCGSVGPEVARGGSLNVSMNSRFFMSDDFTFYYLFRGEGLSWSEYNGDTGEVGGSDLYVGGKGGKGSPYENRDGTVSLSTPLPAPCPVFPLDSDVITELSEPFRWSDLDAGYYGSGETSFRFRLLGSRDVNDTASEFTCTGSSILPSEEMPDGTHYWTVRVETDGKNSSWMYPQRFLLDREAPSPSQGPEDYWLPLSAPLASVGYRENVSGLDPGTAECRAGPPSGPFTEWYPAEVSRTGGSSWKVRARLPEAEGECMFWVRVSDRAGNGPVVAGPFIVNIDGTPPLLTDFLPAGWTGPSFHVSINATDTQSGLSSDFWMESDGNRDERIELEMVPDGMGRFTSTEPVELGEGSHSVSMHCLDIVGNEGVSETVPVRVDGTPPSPVSFSPEDGAVLNDPAPTLSVRLDDDRSGMDRISLHLEGPSGSFDAEGGGVDGVLTWEPGSGLMEGCYTWTASGRDLVGNEVEIGPYHFFIDLSPPVLRLEEVNVTGNSFTISYSDPISPLSELEVSCLVPGPDSMRTVWMRTVSGEWTREDTVMILDIPGEPAAPVSYLSVRGTDAAGHSGDWTEPRRMNVVDENAGPDISAPAFIKKGEKLELVLEFPTGMDAASIRMLIPDKGGVDVVALPESVDILQNGTPLSDSPLIVPTTVKATFEWIPGEGTLTFRISLRDPFPDPHEWITAPVSVITDPEPPLLLVDAPAFVDELPARVRFEARDMHSGLEGLEVFIDGELRETSSMGDVVQWSGEENGTLLLDLEWGKYASISVKARDNAGHDTYRNFTVRATRAPMVSIERGWDGDAGEGEELILIASGEDPDGDHIDYIWYVDGEEAGKGNELRLTLTEGVYNITLNGTDSWLFSEDSFILRVTAHEEGGGGLGLLAFMIIISLLALIAAGAGAFLFLLRRREGSEKEEEEEVLDWDEEEEEEENENLHIRRAPSRESVRRRQCGICLRPIEEHEGRVRCRCGEVFHGKCAAREGQCPECGRELMIRTS